ncbi:hypothetical protein PPERSA_02846 [Pseudocohnilembus persalinus]|uniref:Uncharacterized protein n=1 Tax=Pseudocohnilembus persalinus TaxID=266149 RepID=A0A0V0QMH9_PSEPJ|nr:hypothetical protein PPERSA_02846 [Pseudocohnilembus persalinus]|eukprot:KRX03467.1 hypothetical protein PPERSA_02846 [Pseudocohnilembus persalinus]
MIKIPQNYKATKLKIKEAYNPQNPLQILTGQKVLYCKIVFKNEKQDKKSLFYSITSNKNLNIVQQQFQNIENPQNKYYKFLKWNSRTVKKIQIKKNVDHNQIIKIIQEFQQQMSLLREQKKLEIKNKNLNQKYDNMNDEKQKKLTDQAKNILNFSYLDNLEISSQFCLHMQLNLQNQMETFEEMFAHRDFQMMNIITRGLQYVYSGITIYLLRKGDIFDMSFGLIIGHMIQNDIKRYLGKKILQKSEKKSKTMIQKMGIHIQKNNNQINKLSFLSGSWLFNKQKKVWQKY